MSTLFLRDDLVEARAGGTVELEGAEAKHAVAVNRLRAGERLLIGNGRGLIAEGVVEEAEQSLLRMRVDAVSETAPAMPRLVLVQALAKGDRDELAVQASTELGVSAVVPWAADRSVSRWQGPKIEKGVARWQAIVREASKQSIRSWVPEVLTMHSTKDLITMAATSRMLVLEPTADARLSAQTYTDERDIVLVVGPEGGVSPAELTALTNAGATAVRLGAEVLRTSSAGPAALAVLNAALGRW